MTLIVRPGQVINTETTSVSVGGNVIVGGGYSNSGETNVGPSGNLVVALDVHNSGTMNIDKSEKLKDLAIEGTKTLGKTLDLAKELVKR